MQQHQQKEQQHQQQRQQDTQHNQQPTITVQDLIIEDNRKHVK